jgi:hypothetical protein
LGPLQKFPPPPPSRYSPPASAVSVCSAGAGSAARELELVEQRVKEVINLEVPGEPDAAS